jgi:rhamnosyltransferase subunit B
LRIVFATWGSFGDLHPFLAIAIALKARGHSVSIATCSIYQEKIEREGLSFCLLRPDLPLLSDTKTAARVMDSKLGTQVVLRELMLPALQTTYTDLLYACEGADLLINHSIVFAGPLLAEATGISFLSAILQPIVLASAYDPPVPPQAPWLTQLRWLGPSINRQLLNLGKKLSRHWFEPVDALRKELALPPRSESPIFEGQFSPLGTLALFSSALAAPKPDWPVNTTLTGFPFYDALSGGASLKLSPELSAFLDAGAPPIVFTLGTSAVMTAGDFFDVSVAAAIQLKQRAVLLYGRGQSPPKNLPESIFATDYAPHSLLLTRGALTVHQGGVGTTGQALRAGKPQLIVPFAHDQPDHAARITRLGVGSSLSRERYQVPRVVRVLGILLSNAKIQNRAAAIGLAVRNENGIKTACDAIEKALDRLIRR